MRDLLFDLYNKKSSDHLHIYFVLTPSKTCYSFSVLTFILRMKGHKSHLYYLPKTKVYPQKIIF